MPSYVAWVDESGSNHSLDPGTYILSAVISEPDEVSDIRATMRGLLIGKRHKKLHWRDESPARQDVIAKTIAALQVEHLVVIRSDASELVSLGVSKATLESRGTKDDRRDLRTLDNLRRKRQLGGSIHIDHVGGPVDPMLWIADACCGAVTQMRCGNPEFYAHMESMMTIIEL